MKSLLLTPTFFPQLTGNAVTVERIAHLLFQAGVTCRIINLSETDGRQTEKIAMDFQPDIIHSFHAFKGGQHGLALHRITAVPMITTMTGTDIYVDIENADKKNVISYVLGKSSCITVFNEHARSLLLQYGISGQKISIVHQSVALPEIREVDYLARLNIGSDATVFLLLGGIRKIKNFSLVLPVLEEVRRRFPAIHLIIAGPVIEREEFEKIQAWYEGKPWITYVGEVPRENIHALFAGIDILLNTSSSESEANAVLEAMSCGKLVIARDIPGNASLLTDATGFLFRDDRELRERIFHVLAHKDEWDHMGKRARRHILRSFSASREQAGYLAVYQKCLAAPAFHRPAESLEKPLFSV